MLKINNTIEGKGNDMGRTINIKFAELCDEIDFWKSQLYIGKK